MVGIDTFHDPEMKKLQNWLLNGLSGSDVLGVAPNDVFDDCFFVIAVDSLYIYSSSRAFYRLSYLSTLVTNCSLFCISKSEEENQELAEVLKISRFWEFVHDKRNLGVPSRALAREDMETSEI